jgi:hypothetical protein
MNHETTSSDEGPLTGKKSSGKKSSGKKSSGKQIDRKTNRPGNA